MSACSIELLERTERLTRPALERAIETLELRPGSRCLDVGCGIGQNALRLAKDAGSTGHVTGLDLLSAHLAKARELANECSDGRQLTLVRGSLRCLPFVDACFDLVWCSDTLWPGAVVDCPAEAVCELARLLAPGGQLALGYWSGQSLIAGHPVLEAKLTRAFAERTPYLAGILPEHHFLRAAGWLEEAGLVDVRARTLVADIVGPVRQEQRNALAACAEMLWGALEDEVTADEWSCFRRACTPGSGDCVFERPDYYGFVTYTLFAGTRA